MVVVPMLSQYALTEEYYSTTFHEFTHSTMHEKRCNRQSEGRFSRFGDAAHIQSWLKALKNDNKMIVWAAKKAEEAARYILGDALEPV